ncbi:MAG TPA: gamma-glutamyl-gamma-aminobutyrate hydrolase family protein [Cyclobacteriaceae bacterium]|nr:gamma-glutamyl-gamma-aminobutyrate hydrolase family protein [Cyclobacteriaceae bacterium]
MKEIVIGIAAARKYDNYQRWILESGAKIIKLGYTENNFDKVIQCSGIVLTGGEDVHPKFYGKPEYESEFELDTPDEQRDEFELKILEYTQKHSIPLLGICRGLQIANVYFGGTLIPDILSVGKPDHSKLKEGHDRYHSISINSKSLLNKITGLEKGEVNSAHHQCIDVVGKGLVVCAKSEDGIPEAAERVVGNTFLMLVQWHPERMRDPNSPLTKNIRDQFIKECR